MDLRDIFQKYTGAECAGSTLSDLKQDLQNLNLTMMVHYTGGIQLDCLVNNDIDVYVTKAGGKTYISKIELKDSGFHLD